MCYRVAPARPYFPGAISLTRVWRWWVEATEVGTQLHINDPFSYKTKETTGDELAPLPLYWLKFVFLNV